jgi:hypothetical protein
MHRLLHRPLSLPVVAVSVVALMALAAPANAAATAKVGAACPASGKLIGGGPGVTFVCTPSKGKLVWQLLRPGSPSPSRAATTPAGPTACVAPVHFTKSLIDPASVDVVAPIGGQTGSGGVVAVRSYIQPKRSLDGQHLPLYAPTDMTLTGGTHYKLPGSPYAPEYSLAFDAGCGITVNLFHLKEISARLQTVVPAAPTASSATAPVKSLKITAGEQIGGYVPGGADGVAFDFWVDNAKVTNTFITPARYAHSNYLHAVCPYDLYTQPLRDTWLAKLGSQSSGVVAGTPCGTVSQGRLGTAQGQWFADKDPAVGQTDVLRYDGTYMSQGVLSSAADGAVRIGGFWSPTYIIVGRENPTWADPATVSSDHCWADDMRSVTVRLDSPQVMRVFVAAGGCPALIPADQWKMYYR